MKEKCGNGLNSILSSFKASEKMAKKKSVDWLWERLWRECLEKRSHIHDVDMMVFLGFSPQSWRAWKPRFLEMSTKHYISHTTNDGETQEFVIKYNKNEKFWECILSEYA